LQEFKEQSRKRIDELRLELETKEQNIENLKQQKTLLDQKRLSKQVKETITQTPGKSEAFLNYLIN